MYFKGKSKNIDVSPVTCKSMRYNFINFITYRLRRYLSNQERRTRTNNTKHDRITRIDRFIQFGILVVKFNFDQQHRQKGKNKLSRSFINF